ncbi:alkane 1-monooxygenase [Paenibacillus validus]|uniref:alkane 1-monooxygenase n=1 Tax=Paenibacillus TaxID=44249 RepID=UPI000FD942B5|nr:MULTISPECIES: alkane 1-monooxygenase [Paenibacillus]MED4600943.1 alkane 1-monooxygenase [Paenibacillus validus]MED4606942.1 alkane 1-monooxygenase [Paenibacillus validus]
MLDHVRYYIANFYVMLGIAGLLLGGHWVWLGSLGVLVAVLIGDMILGEDTNIRNLKYPWIADLALYLHVPLTIVLYGVFAWRLQIGFGSLPNLSELVLYGGSILSVALLSAFPNLPILHELMHRRHWFPRALNSIGGTFFGDPNSDIAHIHVHHVHVGTPKDSDTPYRGETVYHFVFRATWGRYKEGFKIERERLRRKGHSIWHGSSRILWAVLMLAIVIGYFYWMAGLTGLVVVIITLFIAKLTIEAFNYTQHYGLIRIEGKPFESRHTWEHDTFFVRAGAVEITTHSDHHKDPYMPFYELKPSDAPKMPSIVLCFLASLIPSFWFKKIVIPRIKYWDQHLASPEERIMASKANRRAGWPDFAQENMEKYSV